MSNSYRRPTEIDLDSEGSFAKFVGSNIGYEGGPIKTTSAIMGIPQYAASSMTVSDILQGTFAAESTTDTLSIINKALTQDLSNLYHSGADSLSSFSTTTASPVLEGGGGSGQFAGTQEAGAQVKSTWVDSLPLSHPSTKALIWQRTGKCSVEMHLPTSGDLSEDKSQHKQLSNLEDRYRHPYYMDRQGGWIGGQSFTPGDVKTGTIGGEDPNKPGQNGAFGYLAPEQEQWYCSMAWPYKGAQESFKKANRNDIVSKIDSLGLTKSAYTGKKVLVYAESSKTAVVCCPGDWGPQPYWTNGAQDKSSIYGSIIGLSPDVHMALWGKISHGETVRVAWAPEDAPYGPYAPIGTQALNPNPGTGGNGYGGTFADASGSAIVNTSEEMKYAGNMILNHPNFQATSPTYGLRSILASGFGVEASNISNVPYYYRDIKRGFLAPSLLNYMWYILEGGFIIAGNIGTPYVVRAVRNGTKLSNHGRGTACDFHVWSSTKFRGRTFSYTDPEWRGLMDSMFGYLATLPTSTRPSEIGCSFASTYTNGLKVFKDAVPNHVHIGFNYNQAGELIPALKKRPASPPPRNVI